MKRSVAVVLDDVRHCGFFRVDGSRRPVEVTERAPLVLIPLDAESVAGHSFFVRRLHRDYNHQIRVVLVTQMCLWRDVGRPFPDGDATLCRFEPERFRKERAKPTQTLLNNTDFARGDYVFCRAFDSARVSAQGLAWIDNLSYGRTTVDSCLGCIAWVDQDCVYPKRAYQPILFSLRKRDISKLVILTSAQAPMAQSRVRLRDLFQISRKKD